MYFDTNLSVVINGQILTTIVEVKTSNDAQNIGARADVIVPLNSYIAYSDPNTTQIYLTAIRTDTFPQGSSIVITANYVGYPPVEIFSGYIFDFILSMPLTIKCLDYIYFFNLGIFGDDAVHTTNKAGTKIKQSGTGKNYKSVQFTDLLQQLVAFANTQIDAENAKLGTNSAYAELILPTLDMTLVNLTFINMSPASILEYFKKNLGLNISFIGNKLYVNIASNTIGTVNLDTGINVIKSALQTNLASFQKIRLKCWFENVNGTRNWVEVGDESGIQQEVFFYNVNNVGNTYDILSNAALLQAQQHHYKGKIEILLYPECDLFYIVNYIDRRYPEKNGQYYIIAMNFELSERGFHREIQLAWLNIPTFEYLKGQTIKSSGIIQT